MAAPQIAPLPPYLSLPHGFSVVLRAVDATTGADVAGVNVTNAVIDVKLTTPDEAPPFDAPTPYLVPASNTA
jgi:hypothetical protein